MSADSLRTEPTWGSGGDYFRDATVIGSGIYIPDKKDTLEKFANRQDPYHIGIGWNVRDAQQQRKAEEELNRQRLAQLKAQQASEAAAKKTAETGGQRMGWGASFANVFSSSSRSSTGFNTTNRGGNLFGN